MKKIVTNPPASMRLDKWLWCARFCKTRGDAAEALRSGKVQVAGQRVKTSKLVTVGMVLQNRSGASTREITVRALSQRRLSATESAALYQESAESVARREALATQMKLDRELHPRPRGRPTQRERRKIIQFRRGAGDVGGLPDPDHRTRE